jgi:hypothetical protein
VARRSRFRGRRVSCVILRPFPPARTFAVMARFRPVVLSLEPNPTGAVPVPRRPPREGPVRDPERKRHEPFDRIGGCPRTWPDTSTCCFRAENVDRRNDGRAIETDGTVGVAPVFSSRTPGAGQGRKFRPRHGRQNALCAGGSPADVAQGTGRCIPRAAQSPQSGLRRLPRSVASLRPGVAARLPTECAAASAITSRPPPAHDQAASPARVSESSRHG